MPIAPARVAERAVIDTRRTLLTLEHPITGQDHQGPTRPPLRWQITKVLINATREGDNGWITGRVEVAGDYLLDDGTSSELTFDRHYQPSSSPRVGGFRYYHADMPTELATLVHDETTRPDGPTLTIRWDYDEQVTISLPGHPELIIANHDRHGWDGMQAAIDVTTAMAQALGLPVVTEGTPNL